MSETLITMLRGANFGLVSQNIQGLGTPSLFHPASMTASHRPRAGGPGPASLNSGYGQRKRSIYPESLFGKGEERRFLLIFGRRQARYGRACQERFSGGGSPLLARCFSQ